MKIQTTKKRFQELANYGLGKTLRKMCEMVGEDYDTFNFDREFCFQWV